jgi:hypothetical protein
MGERFLAEQVLPLVRQRVPNAELDGVEVAADVPEMAAELQRATRARGAEPSSGKFVI